MREDLTVVKKGKGQLGLFTKKSIPRGATVLKLEGKVTPVPTRESIEVGTGEHITDEKEGVYINHSCDPSCEICREEREVRALRDIPMGGEITFDYNENETKMAFPFQCECGAGEKCQGWIAGLKGRK